jgi:predicted nucleic acid-binding protein
MTFAQMPPGPAVFLDANSLIYHFTNDPKYGVACTQLIKRLELQQIQGFTSAHVLADVSHCLMTLEAISLRGWLPAGIAVRLRKHHAEIPKLTIFRQAIIVAAMRTQILTNIASTDSDFDRVPGITRYAPL